MVHVLTAVMGQACGGIDLFKCHCVIAIWNCQTAECPSQFASAVKSHRHASRSEVNVNRSKPVTTIVVIVMDQFRIWRVQWSQQWTFLCHLHCHCCHYYGSAPWSLNSGQFSVIYTVIVVIIIDQLHGVSAVDISVIYTVIVVIIMDQFRIWRVE